jgi:Tol biopolymer transport system component
MPRSQRRPVTAEDLAAIAVIDRPRLSPDGESVAFTLTRTDREARSYRSAIWIVPYAGGDARRTTRDRGASWSPDGRWLVFLSDRDGDRGQLFVIPTAGGEARRLTRELVGIEGVAWSPASDRLAFGS